MIAAVLEKRRALDDICRRYRVKRLVLFGSALRSDFAPERSDLDFLVEFEPIDAGARADAYFGLLFDLEELFGRPIDLVETGAVRNPYVRRTINRYQETVYAAA